MSTIARMPIRVLPPTLVNQIAAGEVIERPASVVKELLENAVDAGATRIDVALEDGGINLISVSDDGAGIPADELPLAIAPHATSKLTSVEDLFNIFTLGFRGEALASIAAVSRLRITSRRHDQPEGATIDAADGEVTPVRPCASAPGTTIEARNLFHSIPARRKFLRTAPAELGHITEQIARIALARPEISLSQTHGGRVIRRLPATSDRRARIADFYGIELADALIPFRRKEPDMLIEGFFAPPAASRANARWQYVFLNGRYIRDRDLSGFVFREAFRGLMEPARFPIVFLFLTAAPDAFDVNVHPQKIEVRWRDSGRVKSQVLAVLREAILMRDLTPALRTGPALFDPNAARANVNALVEQLRTAGEQLTSRTGAAPASAPYALHSPPPAAPGLWSGGRQTAPAGTTGQRMSAMDLYAPPPSPPQAPRFAREDSSVADHHPHHQHGPLPVPALPADPPAHRGGPRTLDPAATQGMPAPGERGMQIHNTYLVCETAEGMLIVDQHALHERVMYEQLKARITAGPLQSQHLLLPETFDVSPEQAAALEGASELTRSLGLEIEPFGPRSIVLRAAPTFLTDGVVREFVLDLLDRLTDGQPHAPEVLLNDMIAMMACKAAVKAGDRLSPELIDALLTQRHLVEKASNCPHGRPTTLRLTVADLERQFKRT